MLNLTVRAGIWLAALAAIICVAIKTGIVWPISVFIILGILYSYAMVEPEPHEKKKKGH